MFLKSTLQIYDFISELARNATRKIATNVSCQQSAAT
jgi:hypothetical protein